MNGAEPYYAHIIIMIFHTVFLNCGTFLQNEVGEVITYGDTRYGWCEFGLSVMNKALLFS